MSTTSAILKNVIVLTLMIAAAVTAHGLRPTHQIAQQSLKVDLDSIVPHAFGEWRELSQPVGQIVTPQQAELQSQIYSQTLSRSYVNGEGAVIMLSIAYGTNQSDGVALHYPEVCYPAQGFQVLSEQSAIFDTGFGGIHVKRLVTQQGSRFEPVTYWATIGEKVVQGGLMTKFTQLRYGIKGEIPDGLLFRISSITSDESRGFELQEAFAQNLISALTPESRLRIIGNPTEIFKQ